VIGSWQLVTNAEGLHAPAFFPDKRNGGFKDNYLSYFVILSEAKNLSSISYIRGILRFAQNDKMCGLLAGARSMAFLYGVVNVRLLMALTITFS
jgi:hypothetical protein